MRSAANASTSLARTIATPLRVRIAHGRRPAWIACLTASRVQPRSLAASPVVKYVVVDIIRACTTQSWDDTRL